MGKGAAAKPTSNVTVQYTGVLYKDGKKFDSSWARKQTASSRWRRSCPASPRASAAPASRR